MKTLHTIIIKNMVCPRCISAVDSVLTKLGFEVTSVKLGEARVLSGKGVDLNRVAGALQKSGFELLVDREGQLVEQIKVGLIEYLKHLETANAVKKMSTYLAERMGIPYPALSRQFSKHHHATITHHLIQLKVERAKELLSYGELSLSEIAHRLKYSSVQHLSAQFHTVTGSSPSHYKGKAAHRHPLDALTVDKIL